MNGCRIEKGSDNIWCFIVCIYIVGGSLCIVGINEFKGCYWVLWEFIIVKGFNFIVLEDILIVRLNMLYFLMM